MVFYCLKEGPTSMISYSGLDPNLQLIYYHVNTFFFFLTQTHCTSLSPSHEQWEVVIADHWDLLLLNKSLLSRNSTTLTLLVYFLLSLRWHQDYHFLSEVIPDLCFIHWGCVCVCVCVWIYVCTYICMYMCVFLD